MNRFIIVDGLPFLYANGKAYRVRWDEEGFTVGVEVELASVPTCLYSEISIKAKCADNLDSIQDTEPAEEPVQEPEEVQEEKPDFESMKLDELKKYASDNGISLNGARTKAAMIEAINNASNK